MKTKFLFILSSVLFVIPIDATITKDNNRRSKLRTLLVNREVQTRSPLDFSMSANDGANALQILFYSPLPDADITVTDENGNIVINETQTSISDADVLGSLLPAATMWIDVERLTWP